MTLIRRIILFTAVIAVVASLVLIELTSSSAQNAKPAKRVPLTVLESSTPPIIRDSAKTLLASSKDGKSIYSLATMTGDLFVFDRKTRNLRKAAGSLSNTEAFTVGPQDNLYLARSDSTVQIMNSQGRQLNKFPTVYPWSIAVLSNGNIVVASPSAGRLLHLYSREGVFLKKFGELKWFDSGPVQNEFLNRGKVIVGSDDHIYYVSTYAPEPYLLRLSSEGQLLGEFQIRGDAVDYDTDHAKDFLRRRNADQTGGVTVITAATVNPDTGHLFLGMNSVSTQGTVYEYNQTGTKVREYALLLNSNNKRRNVTHVVEIAVNSDSLNVLTWGGTYSFKFSEALLQK